MAELCRLLDLPKVSTLSDLSFWEESWCTLRPLAIQFPNLYRSCLNKKGSNKDFVLVMREVPSLVIFIDQRRISDVEVEEAKRYSQCLRIMNFILFLTTSNGPMEAMHSR